MGAETPTHDIYEDSDDGRVEPADDDVSSDPVDEGVTPEAIGGYIATEVILPLGNSHVTGKVQRRKRNRGDNLNGSANINSILDSRTYEV